jgi:hypothetical protein
MYPMTNYPWVVGASSRSGLSFGRWLWYALAFIVIYWLIPVRFRVWFLGVVALGALTRPGVLDRLKSTLAGK